MRSKRREMPSSLGQDDAMPAARARRADIGWRDAPMMGWKHPPAAVLAAILLAVGSGGAVAQEGSMGVGQRGMVAQHYHLKATGCRSGPLPAVRLRQAPRLGRLQFATQTITLSGGLFSSVPAACNGKPVRAIVAIYSAGRRPGVDSFSYEFSFPGTPGPARTKQVSITIR